LVSDAGCVLLMVSRQLIGLPEVAAPGPFHYCGSLGPWPVTAAAKDELLRIGETLVDGLEYRGLLGVDLIWHDGRFWVVEVNPRYTASGELLDFATGKSAVGLHLSACGFETPGLRSSAPVDVLAMSAICVGKLVLYADRRVVAPDLSCGLALRGDWSLPMIADIPQEGSSIPAGAPICTLFASADSAEACEVKLVRRARRIRQWFETAENSLGNGNNS
ncbi:MAG: ATP-grasp domain-containing protein, partial [Planctomycetaceae bacterium]